MKDLFLFPVHLWRLPHDLLPHGTVTGYSTGPTQTNTLITRFHAAMNASTRRDERIFTQGAL